MTGNTQTMSVFLLPLLAILALSSATPVDNSNKVSITFYFESLCPGCRDFLPHKLVPALNDKSFDFNSLISDVTLVPYGHVTVVDASTHKYSCQHGQSECEGNRLFSCAIKYIPETKSVLDYIACLDNSAVTSEYPVDKCQDKIPEGLSSKIMNCYNSDEGWDLFAKNGALTDKFFAKSGGFFVPYVSFNGKRDDDVAMQALEDFKKTLCTAAGVQNDACTDN